MPKETRDRTRYFGFILLKKSVAERHLNMEKEDNAKYIPKNKTR